MPPRADWPFASSDTAPAPTAEELGVTVIAQIEDARKSRGRIPRLVPESVVALRLRQVGDAPVDCIARFAHRHQADQCPCGLRRGTRCRLVAAVVELVAGAVLAPAPVRILDAPEPVDRLADHGIAGIDARRIKGA